VIWFPTLLEVVAAENFVASLHLAISQLLDIFTFSYQQKLTFIRKYRHEIGTLLHFCLELNSLSRYSSSTGERLYDIGRISTSNVSGLSKTQVSISAIHIILPLYLQNMKHNDFMTKNKSKVLKLQSFVGEDKCMNKRFQMKVLGVYADLTISIFLLHSQLLQNVVNGTLKLPPVVIKKPFSTNMVKCHVL